MNTMESDEQQDFERKAETRGFKPLKRKSNYVKKSELITECQGQIDTLTELKGNQNDKTAILVIRYRIKAYQNILDFINSK